MNFHNEKGYTGIDISVSVVILFIFVSIISMMIYQMNSSSKEVQLKTDATYLAINEIENIKNQGIDEYIGKSVANGNNVITENQEVEEGYYKTVTVIDYTDIDGNQDKTKDLVKKSNCKISYMFKAKEQSVELSTVLSKES